MQVPPPPHVGLWVGIADWPTCQRVGVTAELALLECMKITVFPCEKWWCCCLRASSLGGGPAASLRSQGTPPEHGYVPRSQAPPRAWVPHPCHSRTRYALRIELPNGTSTARIQQCRCLRLPLWAYGLGLLTGQPVNESGGVTAELALLEECMKIPVFPCETDGFAASVPPPVDGPRVSLTCRTSHDLGGGGDTHALGGGGL